MWRRKHHENKFDLCMRRKSVLLDVDKSWSVDISKLGLNIAPLNRDQSYRGFQPDFQGYLDAYFSLWKSHP